MKKILIMAALLLPLTVSAGGRRLVILHTNDTHSHVEALAYGRSKGSAGVIERAAFIDSVRKAEGRRKVLLLDAGDISQGTSYFAVHHGDMEVKLVNALRYDAMTLGNHEFDNGIADLARRAGMLKPALVCANYDFSATPMAKYVKPWTIIRRGGYKVGIIGVLSTEMLSLTQPDKMKGINQLDITSVVNEYASYLRGEKKCDLVVCLSHIGYSGVEYSDQDLAAKTANVDIIIGGHTHTYLKQPKIICNTQGKDVMIVTDGCWGINVGKIVIED